MNRLALPLAGWLLWFLALPLAFIFVYSVYQRGPYGEVIPTVTLANYARLFDPLYLGIFFKSLTFATFTTVTCALLGFPMAYVMATARPTHRPLLLMLLMIPFLTNFVVRVYAIRILLAAQGPLNAVLMAIGVRVEPVSLNDTGFAVAFGMVTNYLPFMVLPLYVVFEKLDPAFVEAARDLGASGLRIVRRVLLPLSRRGLASGCLLVFVPTLGEFMIPDLLGGARTMLLGNLITEQFLKARDWPFGAALTVLMMLTMLAGFGLQRLATRGTPGSVRSDGMQGGAAP